MKRRAVFIVGEPGIGKTTIIRESLKKLREPAIWAKPKWTVWNGPECRIVGAGHYTGDVFDGADRVGYNQTATQIDSLGYFEEAFGDFVVFFDGDRFSHDGSLKQLDERGYELNCLLLEDAPLALSRRASRGTGQNEKWVGGRRTKAARFFHKFADGNKFRGTPDESARDFLKERFFLA